MVWEKSVLFKKALTGSTIFSDAHAWVVWFLSTGTGKRPILNQPDPPRGSASNSSGVVGGAVGGSLAGIILLVIGAVVLVRYRKVSILSLQ